MLDDFLPKTSLADPPELNTDEDYLLLQALFDRQELKPSLKFHGYPVCRYETPDGFTYALFADGQLDTYMTFEKFNAQIRRFGAVLNCSKLFGRLSRIGTALGFPRYVVQELVLPKHKWLTAVSEPGYQISRRLWSYLVETSMTNGCVVYCLDRNKRTYSRPLSNQAERLVYHFDYPDTGKYSCLEVIATQPLSSLDRRDWARPIRPNNDEHCRLMQELFEKQELVFVEQFDRGIIYLQEDGNSLTYALFVEGVLDYYLSFEEIVVPQFGKVLNCVRAFRAPGFSFTMGYAQHALFNLILPKYRHIMSSLPLNTDDSRDHDVRAWCNFLEKAGERGYAMYVLNSDAVIGPFVKQDYLDVINKLFHGRYPITIVSNQQ